MAYTIEHPLDFRMTDPDCRCGVRGYLELFEILASEAVAAQGYGNNVLPYRYGIGWIFARYILRIVKRATAEAPLELTTWISSRPHRRFMNREFEVRQAGETMALGRLECCFLDLTQQKVVLPNAVQFPDDFFEERLGMVDVGTYTRIPKDATGSKKVFDYDVRYSDLDNNGHMNNLRYVEAAMDAFTRAELEQREPERFEIHFLSQCRELEALSVCRRDTRADDGTLDSSDVYLVHPEGETACVARVEFAPAKETGR